MGTSLVAALRAAQSGLLTNQAALDAVANNITNVNTPSYSRKIVNLETRVVNGAGTGVQVASITRNIDEGLVKGLREEYAALQGVLIQGGYFEQMQEMFGTPEANTSLSHQIGELTAAVESLVFQPNQTMEQSELVRWGRNVADTFRSMSEGVQELRRRADAEIATITGNINDLLSRISDLNNQIIRSSVVNLDSTDLLDQRDAALDELAKYIDIRYFTRGDGDVVVFTSSGQTLVDNVGKSLSHSAASTSTPTSTHTAGNFDGIYLGEEVAANDITNTIRDGSLKGLIELRDEILYNMQSQLDELSGEFMTAFNQVHNRGLPFPGSQAMSGTRTFIDSATSTISLGGGSDVTIGLLDAFGDESATTTLEAIMQSATYGSGAQAANGPWNIDEVALSIQDWLQGNGAAAASVAIGADGQMDITLSTTTLNLAFRDETATANGSSRADATINFDIDADGNTDETIEGFSNFFGLNDFFDDGLNNNIYESAVIPAATTVTAATLSFTSPAGTTALAVTAGWTLSELAAAINNNVSDISADIIPDGSGFRFRISHDTGNSIAVTSAAGNSIISDMGIVLSDARRATNIDVRDDIINTPSLVSRGTLQWDSNLGTAGEYFVSSGDNTVVKELAETLAAANAFETAGGIGTFSTTFSKYASTLIGRNSELANANIYDTEYKQTLTASLQLKSDSIRGVNLDEEMSNLIVYEQAYSAAARLISTINRMFEALENIV